MEAFVPNGGNAGMSDAEYKIFLAQIKQKFKRNADWHKYLATRGKFTQSRLAIDLFVNTFRLPLHVAPSFNDDGIHTGHPAPSEKGSQAERGPHA